MTAKSAATAAATGLLFLTGWCRAGAFAPERARGRVNPSLEDALGRYAFRVFAVTALTESSQIRLALRPGAVTNIVSLSREKVPGRHVFRLLTLRASSLMLRPDPLSGAITNMVFLSLEEALGRHVFLLFAGISLASGAYVWAYLPETKGRTLLEIQAMLQPAQGQQQQGQDGEGQEGEDTGANRQEGEEGEESGLLEQGGGREQEGRLGSRGSGRNRERGGAEGGGGGWWMRWTGWGRGGGGGSGWVELRQVGT